MERILEICCGDINSVIAAEKGGADRIELCSALESGGLTPSVGLVRKAVETCHNAKVHVLVRPRAGDFLYTAEEVSVMLDDIAEIRSAGADGIVIGALTSEGNVDMEICRKLMNAAKGMSVTFHRAFDMTDHPERALEDIIKLGCDRVLTSGCAPSLLKGAETVRSLLATAGNRITILGGCGVTPENVLAIIEQTGLRELHASARSSVASRMRFRNSSVFMGNPEEDEYSTMATDIEKVKRLVEIIK
ncbi:MAG: copper homeostasis protein CutC [Paramuribaculum sp.]|nr:copper homeostasis protein CutC [Paramuribaculum sp.]MDE6487737.1 copper homeostasis protein CutC [Paramuribaculum sp.]